MIEEPQLNSLRAIRLEPLAEAIGATKILSESNGSTAYFRTPFGKLQITPADKLQIAATDTADSYHFWSGALAGKSGHGAVSFAVTVGLATDFKSACRYLGARPQSAEPLQPMVTRGQPGPAKPYKSPPQIFDVPRKVQVLARYLTGARGIPAEIVTSLARQDHSPIKAGFGPRYEHYVLFPMRNHADPKKPEVGSILRWKDSGDPNPGWFGGEKAPKAPGSRTNQGWWQIGPYPSGTTIITEAPIDALSLWSAMNPKDRASTRIIATGGVGGLDAPGIWAGTERLILAQDRDQAGHKQALHTWQSAYAANCRCPVVRLAPPKNDWNAAWLADPSQVRQAVAEAMRSPRAKNR